MNAFTGREQYVSDNSMRLLRMPLVLLGCFAASVGIAWAMKTLFFQGWYLMMLVPVFGAAIIGGVLNLCSIARVATPRAARRCDYEQSFDVANRAADEAGPCYSCA